MIEVGHPLGSRLPLGAAVLLVEGCAFYVGALIRIDIKTEKRFQSVHRW